MNWHGGKTDPETILPGLKAASSLKPMLKWLKCGQNMKVIQGFHEADL